MRGKKAGCRGKLNGWLAIEQGKQSITDEWAEGESSASMAKWIKCQSYFASRYPGQALRDLTTTGILEVSRDTGKEQDSTEQDSGSRSKTGQGEAEPRSHGLQ